MSFREIKTLGDIDLIDILIGQTTRYEVWSEMMFASVVYAFWLIGFLFVWFFFFLPKRGNDSHWYIKEHGAYGKQKYSCTSILM